MHDNKTQATTRKESAISIPTILSSSKHCGSVVRIKLEVSFSFDNNKTMPKNRRSRLIPTLPNKSPNGATLQSLQNPHEVGGWENKEKGNRFYKKSSKLATANPSFYSTVHLSKLLFDQVLNTPTCTTTKRKLPHAKNQLLAYLQFFLVLSIAALLLESSLKSLFHLTIIKQCTPTKKQCQRRPKGKA